MSCYDVRRPTKQGDIFLTIFKIVYLQAMDDDIFFYACVCSLFLYTAGCTFCYFQSARSSSTFVPRCLTNRPSIRKVVVASFLLVTKVCTVRDVRGGGGRIYLERMDDVTFIS